MVRVFTCWSRRLSVGLGCVLALNSWLQAQQESTKAVALSGDPDAVEAQLQAEVQRQRARKEPSLEYVDALHRLAAYYMKQRRFTGAEAALEQAVAVGTQIPAIPPITQATTYLKLGDVYHQMAQQEGARPSWDQLATLDYFRSAELLRGANGTNSRLLWAQAVIKFATTFRFSVPPNPDEPLIRFLDAELGRALTIAEHDRNPEGKALSVLARTRLVLLFQGKKQRDRYETLCPATLNSGHADQMPLLVACATAALGIDDILRADMAAQHALALLNREVEADSAPERVRALLVVADVARRKMQLSDAEKIVSQALAVCAGHLGPYHFLRVEALMQQARILEDSKRNREAREARKQADNLVSVNRKGAGSPRLAPSRLLKTQQPAYPSEARSKGVEATIVTLCEIGVDGVPHVLSVLNHLGFGLDKEAVNTIQRWRFEPIRKDGKAIASAATLQVEFKLH